MPIDRGMDKEDVVCKYHGILLSHTKRKWNNAICSTWTDPEIIILIKSDRERQVLYDRELICGILKKL